jgi:hypothetical protein
LKHSNENAYCSNCIQVLANFNISMSYLTSADSMSELIRLHLLGVNAAIGVGGLLNARSDADAVLVAARVRDSGRGPDRPGAVNAVGAGNQIIASELQVAVLESPSLTLGVLGGRLSASGVSDLSLAY